jgi:ribose transport system permease protein
MSTTGAVSERGTETGSTRRRLRSPVDAAAVPWVILVVLVAIDAFLNPRSVSLSNLGAVIFGALPLVLAGAGQTLVVLTGGIDLSLAGVLSLTSALLAVHAHGSTLAVWVVICLGLGVLVGAANAACILWLRMQPFIVTLGSWSIVGGCALLVLPSQGGSVPAALSNTGIELLAGIPMSVVILAVIVLVWLWGRRTRPVRRIYAFGSDPQSAVLLGVRKVPTLLLTYALSGLCAALAGVLYTAQVASGDPVGGNSYILTSVAAVVIGGARLAGGRGSVIGTIAGAFVTVYISDVVFGLNLSSFWAPLIQGSLLIAAVLIGGTSTYLTQRRLR